MPKASCVPSVDAKWEADSDARALMEAVAIQKDSKRLKRAQTALKRLEKEAKEATLERQVAAKLKKL